MTQKPSLSAFNNLDVPVTVDLDGTLWPGDCMARHSSYFLKTNPALFWKTWRATRTWGSFKARLDEIAPLDISSLPLHHNVLDWVLKEQDKGRKVVLATATTKSIGIRFAERLGLSTDIIGSEHINLKGLAKLNAIREKVGNDFIYIGDTNVDKAIWAHARGIGIVGRKPKLIKWAKTQPGDLKVWDMP